MDVYSRAGGMGQAVPAVTVGERPYGQVKARGMTYRFLLIVPGPSPPSARNFADRFELKSQAGSGGMGTVYQALDRQSQGSHQEKGAQTLLALGRIAAGFSTTVINGYIIALWPKERLP